MNKRANMGENKQPKNPGKKKAQDQKIVTGDLLNVKFLSSRFIAKNY